VVEIADGFLRHLGTDASQAMDARIVDGLRNFLFDPPAGMDLAAINIQRGHDLGLGTLNETREALGLTSYTSFEQITDDAGTVAALKATGRERIVGTLHEAVIDYIDEQLEGDLADAREYTTTEKGHGREETRTYLQLPAPTTLPGFTLWKGLKTVGMVTSVCVRDGKETIEVRYYISSLPVRRAKPIAKAVRGHWSIENSCHYIIDWNYDEDRSRIRTGFGQQCTSPIEDGLEALVTFNPSELNLGSRARGRVGVGHSTEDVRHRKATRRCERLRPHVRSSMSSSRFPNGSET
jgi:predicted transposase YbfD/YdcC